VPHPRIAFEGLVGFGERLLHAAGDEARYLGETAVTAAAKRDGLVVAEPEFEKLRQAAVDAGVDPP